MLPGGQLGSNSAQEILNHLMTNKKDSRKTATQLDISNDYRRRGQLSAHTQQYTIITVEKHTRTHKQIQSKRLLIALFMIISRGNYKNLGQLDFDSAQEACQLLDGSLEGFWDGRNTTRET